MATPFDNNPKFQSLSPEAQQIVMQRFQSLSPDAQKIVTTKLNPQAVQSAPKPPELSPMEKMKAGLHMALDGINNHMAMNPVANIGQVADSAFRGMADQSGQMAAEKLASKSPTNAYPLPPQAAAAVGTGVQMIPDVLESLPAGKVMAEGAQAATDAVKDSNIVKSVKGTAKDEVRVLSEKAAEAPVKYQQKMQLLKDSRQGAKEAIHEAEKGAGIAMEQMPESYKGIVSDSKKLSQFAVKGSNLADKGAEYLAKTADLPTLQRYRKIAEEGLKSGAQLTGQDAARLQKIKSTFTEAIGHSAPDVQEALGHYRTIEQAIAALPETFKAEKNQLKLALTRARNAAAQQAKTVGKLKTAAKAVGYGALGAVGAKKFL